MKHYGQVKLLDVILTFVTDEWVESAIALAGLVRYSSDFFVYVLQELFEMFYKIKGKEGDRDFLQQLRK